MRIGLVLAATPPYSETFFRNKIRILKEHGFEVILFVDKHKDNFNLCPIRVGFSASAGSMALINALLKLLFNPIRAYKLFSANRHDGFSLKKNWTSLLTSAHLLSSKLDWLHFGFATMAIGRENVAKAIGANMAVSVRGSDLHVYPLDHPNCYQLTWKRIDRLHTISHYLLTLAEQLGFDATQKSCRCITPAIDTQFFKSAWSRPVKQKLKFLTVARLHWIKGIEYILEAMAILKEYGLDFEYHLMGDGDDYKRLYFGMHQLNLHEQVIFHGKQSHEQINKALADTDIFIMYSLDEGFCNSVLEAQVMGALCVVSNNPALMENVIDQETGWVVERRNPKALADRIMKIVQLDEVSKQAIRQKAIDRVNEQFNLLVQKQQFIRFYEEN